MSLEPHRATLPAPSHPIRFYRGGRIVTVDAAPITRTVLDWLREDAHVTGTKEGCNEGDCGACTVVIGEHSPLHPGDGLRLSSVNACLRLLPTLHGKALFTVEDLKRIAGGALHPTQQAMVDHHGSQCGFCTPGFVMSLWHTYETHQQAGKPPCRQQLADALSGNLCRCTGYRPILDAGERMFDAPAVRLDPAPVLAALAEIRAGEAAQADGNGFVYTGPDRQAHPDHEGCKEPDPPGVALDAASLAQGAGADDVAGPEQGEDDGRGDDVPAV